MSKVGGQNTVLNDEIERRPTLESTKVNRLRMENSRLHKDLERTKTALLRLQAERGIEEDDEPSDSQFL
ncbi:prevent-host-death protein [Sesbania bispinosa]|nr:prevent-host-death protein [Sesbania bispinosa]